MKTKIFLLIFSTVVILSCSHREMDINGLRKYLNDEGNGVKKTINAAEGLKIEVFVLRPELVYPALQQKTDTVTYLLVSFSKNGREALLQAGGVNSYANLVGNLSYHPGKFFRLIVDRKDTVQLANSNFSNVYGTAPANSLLLVFNAKLPKKEYQLDMNEIGFDTGDLKVVFDASDIKKMNSLVIKK